MVHHTRSFWDRSKTIKLMKRPIQISMDNNFNFRNMRGGKLAILPFFDWFPPFNDHPYSRKGSTIHFGWLFITVIIHFYKADK